MKTKKLWRNIFVMAAAISLSSCSSSELEYADVEAHEKTVALQEKYVPLIVGSWYNESVNDKLHFYEQLTFNADGSPNFPVIIKQLQPDGTAKIVKE